MECMSKGKESRIVNLWSGVKMIKFPTFYSSTSSNFADFHIDRRSDKEKIRSDYKKSTSEIRKELLEFEILHRKWASYRRN